MSDLLVDLALCAIGVVLGFLINQSFRCWVERQLARASTRWADDPADGIFIDAPSVPKEGR